MEVFAVIPSSAVTTQNSSHDRMGCDTGWGRNEDVLVEMGLCKMEVVKLSCCINSVVLPQRESTNGSSPAVAVRRRYTAAACWCKHEKLVRNFEANEMFSLSTKSTLLICCQKINCVSCSCSDFSAMFRYFKACFSDPVRALYSTII